MKDLVNMLELEDRLNIWYRHSSRAPDISKNLEDLKGISPEKIEEYVAILMNGSADDNIKKIGLSDEFLKLAENAKTIYSNLPDICSAVEYLQQKGVIIMSESEFMVKEGSKGYEGLRDYFIEKNLRILSEQKDKIPSSVLNILSQNEDRKYEECDKQPFMKYTSYDAEGCSSDEIEGYEFLCSLGILEKTDRGYQTTFTSFEDESLKEENDGLTVGGKRSYIANFAQKLLNILREKEEAIEK